MSVGLRAATGVGALFFFRAGKGFITLQLMLATTPVE